MVLCSLCVVAEALKLLCWGNKACLLSQIEYKHIITNRTVGMLHRNTESEQQSVCKHDSQVCTF